MLGNVWLTPTLVGNSSVSPGRAFCGKPLDEATLCLVGIRTPQDETMRAGSYMGTHFPRPSTPSNARLDLQTPRYSCNYLSSRAVHL
jgi:hypothetical protein